MHDISSAYMQRIKNNKTEKVRSELAALLPQVFSRAELMKSLDKLQEKYAFSDSAKFRFKENIIQLDVNWNKKPTHAFFTRKDHMPTDLDILEVLGRQGNSYLSHFSALYFNELTDQRPKDQFITKELHKNRTATPIDEFKIRQAFLKPARRSQNFFNYNKINYYLLEKEWLSEMGTFTKVLRHSGSEHNIRLTTIERTFIDCLIAPHYSGGISNVSRCFENASLAIMSLIEIYDRINPTYPYWQAIGFVLEQIGKGKEASDWQRHFSKERMIPFYIDHSAKSSWKLSKRWQVFYPGEVFHESAN